MSQRESRGVVSLLRRICRGGCGDLGRFGKKVSRGYNQVTAFADDLTDFRIYIAIRITHASTIEISF
jgi:hypothetical protein